MSRRGRSVRGEASDPFPRSRATEGSGSGPIFRQGGTSNPLQPQFDEFRRRGERLHNSRVSRGPFAADDERARHSLRGLQQEEDDDIFGFELQVQHADDGQDPQTSRNPYSASSAQAFEGLPSGGNGPSFQPFAYFGPGSTLVMPPSNNYGEVINQPSFSQQPSFQRPSFQQPSFQQPPSQPFAYFGPGSTFVMPPSNNYGEVINQPSASQQPSFQQPSFQQPPSQQPSFQQLSSQQQPGGFSEPQFGAEFGGEVGFLNADEVDDEFGDGDDDLFSFEN